jgi:hypothetical protein
LLFRSIIKSGDYLSELEQGLKNLRHLTVLLVNGDMDNGLKAGFDSRFQKIFLGVFLSREELTLLLDKYLLKQCDPLLVDTF